MRFRTTGIVLYEQSVSENDKLVTLLTSQKGVVRAFARGAKNPSNRKSAGTQQFCYSEFDLYLSTKNVLSVQEAMPIETFFNLRTNIKSISLAQYFCEIMIELAPREENSDDFLKLILNSLFLLMNEKRTPNFLKPVFELRLLSLSGYMPNIVACDRCAEFQTETMFFSVYKGCLFCEKCNTDKYNFPLSISCVTAMRHVCFSDISKLYSFSLKENALKQFSEITEKYLLTVTQRKYKTLDFYKITE